MRLQTQFGLEVIPRHAVRTWYTRPPDFGDRGERLALPVGVHLRQQRDPAPRQHHVPKFIKVQGTASRRESGVEGGVEFSGLLGQQRCTDGFRRTEPLRRQPVTAALRGGPWPVNVGRRHMAKVAERPTRPSALLNSITVDHQAVDNLIPSGHRQNQLDQLWCDLGPLRRGVVKSVSGPDYCWDLRS